MTADARFQSTDAYYAGVSDARDRAFYRDPVITPGDHGRADVANGKRGRWGRYNDPATLVWATNSEGQTYGLTRNQANVYGEIREIAGTGTRVTLRALAGRLHIAASTAYRAIVRLAALGFIAYQSNRGRLGGSVFLLRIAKDDLGWCRDAARMMLRKWWKASEERISRLRVNVASMYPTTTVRLVPPTDTDIGIERNIYEEWSVQDFREAGLM